jgi:hypothetical protein
MASTMISVMVMVVCAAIAGRVAGRIGENVAVRRGHPPELGRHAVASGGISLLFRDVL